MVVFKKAEHEEAQRKTERNEQLKAIGRERLEKLIPADAKAIIIAELHQNESDPMTDYYGYRTQRTVILGFSTHTKDLFSEIRKYAANLSGRKQIQRLDSQKRAAIWQA